MAVTLTTPVSVFRPVDLLADGSIERWADGREWTAETCPRGHPPAHPGCDCGVTMAASQDPPGVSERPLDRYRDRLGHRMRVLAGGLAWGRVVRDQREPGHVRAEHVRLVALAVAEDESPKRLHRARATASRYDLRVIPVRAKPLDHGPLAAALADAGGAPVAAGMGSYAGRYALEVDSAAGGLAAIVGMAAAFPVAAGGAVLGLPAGVMIPLAMAAGAGGYFGVGRLRGNPEREPDWYVAAPPAR